MVDHIRRTSAATLCRKARFTCSINAVLSVPLLVDLIPRDQLGRVSSACEFGSYALIPIG
jgi:hypothetical protein